MRENPERRSALGIIKTPDGTQPPGMNRLLHREDQARIIERAFLRAVVVGFFAGAWAGVVGGGIVFMAVFAGVGAVIFLVSMSLGLIAQSRGK